MIDSTDATGRFTGLAAGYDRHRPDYPAPAVDFIIARAGLQPGSRFVDVGCGTGIATRLFAARGLVGIGIEPNDDMRRIAEAAPGPTATYRAGKADATGLPDACTDLVLAAQAFHWFPHEAALNEFHRILVPGGSVALMWYEQDRTDPFADAYVAAQVAHSPEPHVAAWQQSDTGAALMNSRRFIAPQRHEFVHAQSLDGEQVIGRALSASYAPKVEPARGRLLADLRIAFEKHQVEGRVAMKYRIVVYIARRA